MGAILAILKGDDDGSLMLDFENARPSPSETALFNEIQNILSHSTQIIQALQAYEGCSSAIQKALTYPTPENEEVAFQAVKNNVLIIQQFYNFAKSLESVTPRLLDSLSRASVEEDKHASPLSSQTALAKQLGEILDFVLKFDEIKMLKPGLQNDFSYYRRSMPKRNLNELTVSDEEANFISLFLAAHIPMMTVLIKCVSSAASQNDNILAVLAAMANICCSMVFHQKFANPATNVFCLRAMSGAIVLFDNVDQFGAFRKKSPIHIKKCCNVLCSSPLDVQSAKNAVRYSTKHFSDDETSDSIKALFE